MSTEYNLCPKCGGVKSLKQPTNTRLIHVGAFKACTCPKASIAGRAETPEQRRAIVERVLAVWPSGLRLGQLIECAVGSGPPLFYIEDEALVHAIETFAKEHCQ